MAGESEIRALLDKQAIHEALYAYCRSVDRLDHALGHAVFHEDSHADYGEGVYQGPGRGAIDTIIKQHDGLTSHSHQVSNVLIALDGDRAGSEAYMTGTMRMQRDGKEFQIFVRARYLDRWEKRDGRWGIVERAIAYDHDEVREVTAMRGTHNSTRDTSDPSYGFLQGFTL
ncbi:nuclear transport factor 2 family protein [Novosphingobium sp. JCM 18896]|uniref:nuclear transport factor 2 family protein n=1 Tax=Novosphingobium sp. JCM 18896 TaxID=2989731 RepID=UPI002221834B|nr:nuclear transport factor 2 family protein [Novosphingobium sp. JCM 18896]MCW1428739.1 nuclear transport factor 2 family protein [Novosphingobium sp. JCM 18896]